MFKRLSWTSTITITTIDKHICLFHAKICCHIWAFPCGSNLFCFVSFWLRIYVYIRFDGSEKIRKCYDLTFPFLKVIDGKSKFQTLTLGMKILSHLRRERTSESAHTRALKLQSDIYWQNAYAFMCRIGMNHSLQEIWKFTTGNTSTNENTENKASTTMASSKENANSIKSPKSQLSL